MEFFSKVSLNCEGGGELIFIKGERSMKLEVENRKRSGGGERKVKYSSLFCRFVMPVVIILYCSSLSYGQEASDLEVMRQEVQELRKMVLELSSEVRSLREDKVAHENINAQYQLQLEEIRSEVTELNNSPLRDLESALNKVHIGSYGEVHANLTQGSESDKIDFHRMVLYLGYDFADWIRFHSETELEHAFVKDNDTEDGGQASGGEISLEQAYVDFLFSDKFNIRAGRLLTPLGIINQYHEPTLFNGVERPNFSKFIIPTTWSSDGLGIFGSLNPSLNYEAYVVAGLNGDGFNSKGIRDGRIKSRQSLNEVAFTGRLDYRPFEEALANSNQSLRLGLSGYFGGLDNKDGGGGTGKDAEIAMTSADFEYSVSKFDFRGVIAHTNVDGARDLGDGDVAKEMFGWYLEGAYHFWPDEWKTGKLKESDATVFVRYEDYDTQYKMPSGVSKDKTKDREDITLGVNFYLTPNFVIKADYQFFDDASGEDVDNQLNLGLGWVF
jgi:hypothetical protein